MMGVTVAPTISSTLVAKIHSQSPLMKEGFVGGNPERLFPTRRGPTRVTALWLQSALVAKVQGICPEMVRVAQAREFLKALFQGPDWGS